MAVTIPEADEVNAWRLNTPGSDGWLRSPHADAEDKFFMCSADGHVQEPNTFERTMGHLTDGERAKILGLNAARIFKFDIPERYLNHEDARVVSEQVRSEK